MLAEAREAVRGGDLVHGTEAARALVIPEVCGRLVGGPFRAENGGLAAVGRSILVIIWHLLADPTADFVDLGPDFHDRHVSTQRAIRSQVRHLEALGYQVNLHRAA